MASKSAVVQGMWFGAEFLSNVYKTVVRRGGTAEEMHDAMKTEGDLAEEVAELIVSRAKSAKRFALNHLRLIAERIPVSSDAFTKDSFFKNGPVKLWFGDNFKNRILRAIPETITSFTGNLTKTVLTKYMYDSEIQKELGSPESFTVSEFAAIVKVMLEKQPHGEEGTLLTNGCVNIFYVQLEDTRVVAVYVSWGSRYCGWYLGADRLDDSGWFDGASVFSRS